ncbi:unnamed protein product [Euphydryas editha]|uniref:Uncharacterized protein n=1 Tax=Euphydryas editha TaxID=104508 RepID=A0AAU9UU60_EUPED|nr:unnamed protein product [Euphydryas editha]
MKLCRLALWPLQEAARPISSTRGKGVLGVAQLPKWGHSPPTLLRRIVPECGQCGQRGYSPTLIRLCSWWCGCRLAGAGGGDCATHASFGLPALLPSLEQRDTRLLTG